MDTGTTVGYLVGVLVFGFLAIVGLSYLGFFTINIYMLMYVVYAVLLGLGTTIFFMNNGQSATAITFLLLALGVFIFYGLRWFGQESVFNPPTSFTWPPYINTCPDFLYYYRRRGTEDTCVDPIGVSRGGTLTLNRLSPGDIKSQEDNDRIFFPLETSGGSPDAIQRELCQRAKTYGLTWEGVTDGQSCMTRTYGTKDLNNPATKKCE
jgi:hypothetical protein